MIDAIFASFDAQNARYEQEQSAKRTAKCPKCGSGKRSEAHEFSDPYGGMISIGYARERVYSERVQCRCGTLFRVEHGGRVSRWAEADEHDYSEWLAFLEYLKMSEKSRGHYAGNIACEWEHDKAQWLSGRRDDFVFPGEAEIRWRNRAVRWVMARWKRFYDGLPYDWQLFGWRW